MPAPAALPELGAGLSVEEVTTTADLEALHPEWSALWGRCPSATPFQSPEWLLPWWRHFGGVGLWALVLRRHGRLVGLAPLFVWKNPESGARTVLLMGTGISDYVDALFEPESAEADARAVLRHLAANRQRWDCCDFQQLRPDSPLLTAPAPAGCRDERAAQDSCLVLSLPARREELARSVSPRFLERLRYQRRRAEALGEVRVDCAGPDNVEELFDALVRLHGARWDAAGQAGVLADGTLLRFHRDAVAGLLRGEMLRLYGLRIGGRIVAALYGFASKGRTYYYLGGFDPELGRLSLGAQVVGHAVTAAIDEGCTEFDFLRGQETYKYQWGARERPAFRRSLLAGAPEGGYGHRACRL